MSKLTRDDVLKLARLSRLALSEDELQRFQKELTEILTYVEALSKVDTTGLEPTYQVSGLTSVMRQDELIDYQAKPEDLLKNAPVKPEKNQFKVRRIL